jgi:hypothetical protein
MQQVARASRVQGFRIHALVFFLSIGLMAVINVAIGPPYWFQWPLLGWGAGVVFHWFFAVGPGSAP